MKIIVIFNKLTLIKTMDYLNRKNYSLYKLIKKTIFYKLVF